MFTAKMAEDLRQDELDLRIRIAVENGNRNSVYMRINIDDKFLTTLEADLQLRGFKNIGVPAIVKEGFVYFEW